MLKGVEMVNETTGALYDEGKKSFDTPDIWLLCYFIAKLSTVLFGG